MTEMLSLGRWPLGLGDVCFYPRLDNYNVAAIGAMLGVHLHVRHLGYRRGGPYGLREFAGIRQVRGCAPGQQPAPGGAGVMGFGKVKGELERVDFRGPITVEYFDLPWVGYPSQTPFYDTLT